LSSVLHSGRERAIATIVSAFADDPVERWMFPDPDEYLEHFPRFVAAFAGAAFEQRTAWQLGEFAAVALWLPPDAEADAAAIARVFTESVRPDKHANLFAVGEQMERAHPAYPHWYLPWLAAIQPARGPASAASCCGTAWGPSTPTASPHTWRRPTRARSPSTSATASR
jgi:hypothetical protein